MRYFIILFVLLLVRCANDSQFHSSSKSMGDNFTQEESDMQVPRTAEAPPPPSEYELEKGSKIIKEGNLNFEVTHLKEVKAKVDTILNRLTGYYENEQFHSYDNQNSYSLKIRIPNAKFDSLIFLLESGMGKLQSKNISAKDVTEEYVDLNIRLNNNLAYLDQYKQLLKKANSIKDILEIQEKIRNLEEEIDSKKGRIKFLDDKVQYSTIHLELNEFVDKESSNKFISRIGNAFHNGSQLFLNFIIGLVNLWPFLILIILVWFFRKNIFTLLKRK